MTFSVLASVVLLASATPPNPPAGPSPEADRKTLADLRAQLAQPTVQGDEAGRLHEKEGEVLVRLGRTSEAADAYASAARSYSQSPAGTGMPEINSARALKRAAELRAAADGGPPRP